jgi:selenocysteine lyase/cysteine desulfurase
MSSFQNNGKGHSRRLQTEVAQSKLIAARYDFDLPKEELNTLTRVYLNAASRTPLMKETVEAGQVAMARQMQTPWSIASEEDELKVREAFATLINCHDSEQIAYTPSCSYAISLAAKNIFEHTSKTQKDTDLKTLNKRILILEDQMSSNVYPWQHLTQKTDLQLHVVKESGDDDANSLTDNIIGDLLNDSLAITIAALPNVHWCSGEVIDIIKIGKICFEKGICLVIDGTQSLGVLPFDVQKVKPDFVCASVHKHLFGPYGMCLMYASKKWCSVGVPLEYHEHKRRGAAGDVCLPFNVAGNTPYEERYASGAMRFCAGGRINPIIVPMLAHSLNKIVYEWGVENISQKNKKMTDEIKRECDDLGLTTAENYHHIIGIKQRGNLDFPEQISRWLKDKVNIIISARFKYLRVAPQVYNTPREVTIFVRALREFMRLQLLVKTGVRANALSASTFTLHDKHNSGHTPRLLLCQIEEWGLTEEDDRRSLEKDGGEGMRVE